MLRYNSNSSRCVAVFGGRSAGKSSNMFVDDEAVFEGVFCVCEEFVSNILNIEVIIDAP